MAKRRLLESIFIPIAPPVCRCRPGSLLCFILPGYRCFECSQRVVDMSPLGTLTAPVRVQFSKLAKTTRTIADMPAFPFPPTSIVILVGSGDRAEEHWGPFCYRGWLSADLLCMLANVLAVDCKPSRGYDYCLGERQPETEPPKCSKIKRVGLTI